MPGLRTERFFRHGTLPQMRVFEAVARLGSFTRAGEETHMAQPTVSVHMKKLAETVGAPLVKVTAKRVELTPAGEELYAAVRRIMQTLRELDDSLCAIAAPEARKLRIATTTAGEYLLPPLLAQFVKLHPGIDVTMHAATRPAVLQRLARGEDDLYLLTDPPAEAELSGTPILPNPLIALAPCDHPLTRERSISFERFAREPLLVRESGSGTRLAIEGAFAAHELEPRIAMELGGVESIREAMLAGLGVALLHRYSLGFDIEARRLCVLDVEGLPQDGQWHVIPAPGRTTALAEAFIDFAASDARRIFDERESDQRREAPAGAASL